MHKSSGLQVYRWSTYLHSDLHYGTTQSLVHVYIHFWCRHCTLTNSIWCSPAPQVCWTSIYLNRTHHLIATFLCRASFRWGNCRDRHLHCSTWKHHASLQVCYWWIYQDKCHHWCTPCLSRTCSCSENDLRKSEAVSLCREELLVRDINRCKCFRSRLLMMSLEKAASHVPWVFIELKLVATGVDTTKMPI